MEHQKLHKVCQVARRVFAIEVLPRSRCLWFFHTAVLQLREKPSHHVDMLHCRIAAHMHLRLWLVN
jgi:hypothetical protein